MRMYSSGVSLTVDAFKAYHPQFSLKEFRAEMREFGFTDEWDLELLVAKYFYGQSQKEIAKSENYVSQQTVSRRLGRLRELLKERGFKPKGRK